MAVTVTFGASSRRRAAKRKVPKPKKHGRVANRVLVFGMAAMMIFTAVMIWLFVTKDAVPDVLIDNWFRFWGFEFCGMLLKRVFDKRNEALTPDGVDQEGDDLS